jgi:hypothetical protein
MHRKDVLHVESHRYKTLNCSPPPPRGDTQESSNKEWDLYSDSFTSLLQLEATLAGNGKRTVVQCNKASSCSLEGVGWGGGEGVGWGGVGREGEGVG